MDKITRKILGAYCKRGFHLFPIKRETKRPAIMDMLNKASADMDQLEKWFKKFPKCNWGLSLAKSGLVAVDVDWKHGGMESWKTYIDMKGEPETLKAITGSQGFHYVFKAEAKRYRGKIQDGIDIKYNGYTVVYPSKHQDTKKLYKWVDWKQNINTAPEWLKDLIEKDERVGKSAPTYKFGNKYIERLVKMLKEVPLSYEEWVQCGMAIHASDPSENGLALFLEVTQGENYEQGDEEKAEGKWSSFGGNGISPLSLGYILRKHGREVPNPNLEEDKRAFKEAQREDIQKQKDEDGFAEKNGKLLNWSRGNIIEYFNTRGYAFLIGGGQSPFLRVRPNEVGGGVELLTMSERSLRDLTAPLHYATIKETQTEVKTVLTPAYREWVESPKRRQFKKVVFKPEADKHELNLWTQLSPLDPIKGQGLPDSIKSLIFESLCDNDQEKGEWLLDWLAHLIQKPWERVSTVPVHISKQGAGKGILYDMIIKEILGAHYLMVMTSGELMSRFNVHLSKRFLTFIDEATWRGNKTEDGILKRLIGSPTMSVEEKFGLRYEIENYSRYVIASNNKEAVAVELGNRRYVLIEGNPELANDGTYFSPLVEAIQANDGAAMREFYGFLLERNISTFEPHQILKNNMSGAEAKIATMGPVAMFWEDTLFENPRKLWLKERGLYRSIVFGEFNRFCNEIKTYTKSISPTAFWKKTKELVPQLPEKTMARTDEGGLAKVMPISPKKFASQFCKTVQIDSPEIITKDFLLINDFEEEQEFDL